MPLLKSKWLLPAKPPEGAEGNLPADLPPGLARTLLNRGLDTGEKLRFFLEPPHRLPYCPLRLDGMEAALQRLHQAMGQPDHGATAERVGIVGDFDVDGVTGTAILLEGLADFGIPTIPYLPHRVSEGHGLSAEAVRWLAEQEATLIITVDCGVSSNAEAALAAGRGLDVIITDHHAPPDNPPEAVAIINPRMPGNEYPCPYLCGAGLAFKLVQGLYRRYGRPAPRRLLELAALGTIADLVPLKDENRYLVREGLQELAKTRRPGLRALYRRAGIQAADITAETVSFQIAPRLNSPGRMGHARDSLRLLTTDCPEEAEALAEQLEEQNRQRRELTRQVCANAKTAVAGLENLPPLLLVQDPQITPGVAGLVAGQLAREFHRPAVALAPLEGDNLMASGRSIPAFNLIQGLNHCADLFLRYGGHAQAGGFTIKETQVPLLERRITALAGEQLDEAELQSVLPVDAEIQLAELTPDFLRWLKELEPYGQGNPQPVFLTRNLAVVQAQPMGREAQHLKLLVQEGARQYTALAFEWAEEGHPTESVIDLVYSVSVERWRGSTRLSLLAHDFRPAAPGPGATFGANSQAPAPVA